MNSTHSAGNDRTLHLDGIRGVAALAVALFHFARAFDSSLVSYSHAINQTLLSTLWNGPFAVALFFVLSGYLFFEKFHASNILKGAEASVKRFLRLSIPILSVCLTAYIIHKLNFFTNQEAALISKSDWLGRWYKFHPDITLAITESLWLDFIAFDPMRTYNSNLWTISYELFAVIGVIILAISTKSLKNPIRVALALCVAAACYGTHYFEFALGAALALALTIKRPATHFLISISIIAVSLSISALVLPTILSAFATDILYPLGATLLIAAVGTNKKTRAAFSNKVFLKLGELSFGLYLMHFLTINSVASYTYLHTESLTITFISYSLSTLVLSAGFTYMIDQPWTKLLNSTFRKRAFRIEMFERIKSD